MLLCCAFLGNFPNPTQTPNDAALTEYLPNPPSRGILLPELPWGGLNFSTSAWLHPALSAPPMRSVACYDSLYRWPKAWTGCLAYASTHKDGLIGLPPGSTLPFAMHSGHAMHKVTTCDTPTFSLQETREAQAWIFAAQHPLDCATAQLGIADYFNSGMGSSIFGTANSFMLALARGHVWLPVGSWVGGHCPLGTMECFFEPVSNCTPPLGGVAAADGVRVHSASSANPQMANRVVAVPLKWQHKGFLWWRAQVVAYMLRPNNATSAALTTAARSLFPRGLPRPFAGVFLRHGDKVGESPVFRAPQYLELLRAPIAELKLKAVFVSSDTQEVNDEAVRVFGEAGSAVYTVPRDRGQSVDNSEPKTKVTESFALVLFLDLFILANADVVTGISTSNWVRLFDALRLALGHGAELLPLLDPFGVPYVEW